MHIDEVREVLNEIIDPCSSVAGCPAGLIDMGLVRDLVVTPRGDGVDISMTVIVTEPSCVMSYPFANEARTRLSKFAGVRDVDVALDHSFVWDESSMTANYQERLAAHRRTARARAGLVLTTKPSGRHTLPSNLVG